MFVQDFKVIDGSYHRVVQQLLSAREALFREALGTSRSAGDRIIAKVSPKGWPTVLGKAVEIHPGAARHHDDTTLVSFWWAAHGGESLFPRLDADLEVAPFGADQTMLTVRGTYEPPAGWPGRIADELLLHHLAESTVRAFLDTLGTELSRAPAHVEEDLNLDPPRRRG